MKKTIAYSIVVLVVIGLLNLAHAHNRMDRLSWTDRGLSNPPLAPKSSIDSTIEQFWNVTFAEEPGPSPGPRANIHPTTGSPAKTVPSTKVQQDRNTRERRGYFGINLFNAIPLIDFVHGGVTTESGDHVTGHR